MYSILVIYHALLSNIYHQHFEIQPLICTSCPYNTAQSQLVTCTVSLVPKPIPSFSMLHSDQKVGGPGMWCMPHTTCGIMCMTLCIRLSCFSSHNIEKLRERGPGGEDVHVITYSVIWPTMYCHNNFMPQTARCYYKGFTPPHDLHHTSVINSY